MAEQDISRSEQATPYKLEKAKEKGQTSRSTELAPAAVLLVAIVVLGWAGSRGLLAYFTGLSRLLGAATRLDGSPANLWRLIAASVQTATSALLPLFLALMGTGVIVNMMQTGGIFALQAVKPDVDRINPAAGFKRLMSMRTLFNAGKAVAKTLVLSAVACYALARFAPQLAGLAAMPAAPLLETILADINSLGMTMVFALGILALIDMVFSKADFAKKMRMSRKEIEDEVKHREGDPRIRRRMRELRRELMKRLQSLGRSGSADVVITNPTHYAVALRYEQASMHAPVLVAKGAGAMAAAIRQVASLHGIPIVQNAPLARELFKGTKIDAEVPTELFGPVARIMVWVFARRAAARRNGQAA